MLRSYWKWKSLLSLFLVNGNCCGINNATFWGFNGRQKLFYSQCEQRIMLKASQFLFQYYLILLIGVSNICVNQLLHIIRDIKNWLKGLYISLPIKPKKNIMLFYDTIIMPYGIAWYQNTAALWRYLFCGGDLFLSVIPLIQNTYMF